MKRNYSSMLVFVTVVLYVSQPLYASPVSVTMVMSGATERNEKETTSIAQRQQAVDIGLKASMPHTSDDAGFAFVYGSDARVSCGYGFWQMAYGSKADLTAANLRAAYTAMTKFKSDNGSLLGINPTHLVVGNTNFFVAKDILESAVIDASTNTNRNLVQLLKAPKLAA